jgi:DNA-binding MarR family transcriptional regulator
VSDVGDAVDQILAQWATFSRYGLDAPAFDVLAALRRAGPPYQLTPTALMRTALVTSGAITQRLDRLEEKGLITRERSEVDGRAVVVTLTDAGRAALDAALPDHLETERKLLDGLTVDEREQLAALLRRLLVARGRVPQEP